MKLLSKSILIIATTALISVSANANTNLYVGAKGGKLMIDEDKVNLDGFKFEDPWMYGVYGGYGLDSNFAVEAEYTMTEKGEVEYTGANSILKGVKATLKSQTGAAYGVYRYHLPETGIYGKGKLGYAFTKAESEAQVKGVASSSSSSAESEDSGLAFGVGVGYEPTSNIGIEAEYSKYTSDSGAVTVGAHIKF